MFDIQKNGPPTTRPTHDCYHMVQIALVVGWVDPVETALYNLSPHNNSLTECFLCLSIIIYAHLKGTKQRYTYDLNILSKINS